MVEILEQLKQYCSCFDTDVEDSQLEKNIMEVIQYVSNLTCWQNETCETFLNSERKETFTAKDIECCGCDGGLFSTSLFYAQIKADTIGVTVFLLSGLEETSTILSPEEFFYSEAFQTLRVNVAKYLDCCGCCPPQMKIVVTYEAGYELLPDCLLPLFCDLLHVVNAKNACDCKACQACKPGNNEGIIVGFDEEGDETEQTILHYTQKLILSGYQNVLGLISLCGKNTQPVWGMVV
ncbi:hypothetical protein FACS189418_6870 [Clostridia bacterium]|nr:hypothetical protein FACS189418_6870 [Clostridia bacterium]